MAVKCITMAWSDNGATHIDPPIHLIDDGRSVDEIPVSEMLRPLVILDIKSKVLANPDAVPSLEDLESWEGRHGRVPEGAFVALRTGWSSRWPNTDSFYNRSIDGVFTQPRMVAISIGRDIRTS